MSRKSKKLRVIKISFILFLASASVYSGYAQRTCDLLASCIVYPVLAIRHSIIAPTLCWMKQNRCIAQLQKQLVCEQTKNKLLTARYVAQQATKSYATDIAPIIDFQKRFHTEHAHIAHVISRTLERNNQSLLINRGSLHGIKNNMIVLADNALVGKIINVYPWYARVQLITDPACKVAAHCAQTNAHGIAHGLGKNNKTMLEHVSHLDEIKVGDVVVSSGKGLIFPQGFALGKVAQVETKHVHHEVQLQPLCDFETLDYCVVLGRESI